MLCAEASRDDKYIQEWLAVKPLTLHLGYTSHKDSQAKINTTIVKVDFRQS